jgi:hypothetical protein
MALIVTGGSYRGSPFEDDASGRARAERVMQSGRFELWRVVRTLR